MTDPKKKEERNPTDKEDIDKWVKILCDYIEIEKYEDLYVEGEYIVTKNKEKIHILDWLELEDVDSLELEDVDSNV